MSTVKVRFVEAVPPIASSGGRKKGRTAGKYAKVVKTLTANPNRWALVDSVQKKSRAMYAQRILGTHGVKVAIRKAGGNWFRVYACYMPVKEG